MMNDQNNTCMLSGKIPLYRDMTATTPNIHLNNTHYNNMYA